MEYGMSGDLLESYRQVVDQAIQRVNELKKLISELREIERTKV